MRPISAVALTVALAACAQAPEKIQAIEAPPGAYSGLSCSRLASEERKVGSQLDELSALQRKTAQNDAVGVFLVGMPLASMSGGDAEARIASLKGQAAAIDARQAATGCQ